MNDAHPDRAWVPLTAAAGAVLAWSWGPVFVREVGVSTQSVVFWRMWVATPVTAVVALLSGGRFSLALLRRSVLPGLLFAGCIVTSFASYETTSIANATLIGALQPALVLLVAPRLFGDRVNTRQIGFAALAFAGMVIVVFGAGSSSGASMRGDLYAVVNMLIWAVYFVRVKQLRNDGLHAWSFLACVFFVAALAVSPWALTTSHDLGAVSGRGWWFVVLMCLGPGLAGHGSMTWAQRHLDISLAALLTLVQPALSTLWAWWLYDERLVMVQVVGAIVVLGALVGVVQQSRAAPVERATALSVAGDGR